MVEETTMGEGATRREEFFAVASKECGQSAHTGDLLLTLVVQEVQRELLLLHSHSLVGLVSSSRMDILIQTCFSSPPNISLRHRRWNLCRSVVVELRLV